MSEFQPIEPDVLERSPISDEFEKAGLPAAYAEWLTRLLYAGGFIGWTQDNTPTSLFIQKTVGNKTLFNDRMLSACKIAIVELSEIEQKIISQLKNLISSFHGSTSQKIFSIVQDLAGIYPYILNGVPDKRHAGEKMVKVQELLSNIGVSLVPEMYTMDWFAEFCSPSLEQISMDWNDALSFVKNNLAFKLDPHYATNLLKALPKNRKDCWLTAIEWSLLRKEAPPASNESNNDARQFGFWFGLKTPEKLYREPYTLDYIFQQLKNEPDESLGSVALRLSDVFVNSLSKGAWNYVAPESITILGLFQVKDQNSIIKLLLERGEESNDESLQRAILRFLLLGISPDQITCDEFRKYFLAVAKRELGQARSTLRDANGSTFNPKQLNAPLAFLFKFGGPDLALEALLTMFSASTSQMVAGDLRYWKEDGREDPPEPHRWIAERIATIIHSLKDKQIQDPKLKDLRSSLAEFFIKRLKTRKEASSQDLEDSDFVEDRWKWRYFYIRALRELKINPKGKGHKALHWVSKNDPHPEVRKEAKNAYKELRHQASLPSEASPRKALFAAYWWLRQAHLTELGVKIDISGAQRTRSKEVTYTGRH